MLCLRFDTLEQADQRNHEEATRRGCTGNVTCEWWQVREQDGKVYLIINNDEVLEGEVVVEIEDIVPTPVPEE